MLHVVRALVAAAAAAAGAAAAAAAAAEVGSVARREPSIMQPSCRRPAVEWQRPRDG